MKSMGNAMGWWGGRRDRRAPPGQARRRGGLQALAWLTILWLSGGSADPGPGWWVGPRALAAQASLPVAEAPLDRARTLLDAHMPVTAAALLSRELSTGGVEGDEAVLLAARAFLDQRSWTSARRLLAARDFSSAAAAARARLLLARAYLGLDSASRAVESFRAHLDALEGPPPLAVRVDLAQALRRLGRWPAAAAQLDSAAAEEPDLARWIDLTRLYVLAEADDPAAYALADSIAGTGRVPADSAILTAARLAFRLGDPARGTALAGRGGTGVWNALAARDIGPYLLSLGDSAGASGALRDAIESRSYAAETGPSLLALDRSWQTLLAVGRSDSRSGRHERAAGYLAEALELAPDQEKSLIAEQLASAHVALGDANRAAQVLAPWMGGGAAAPEDRASMWLLAARIFSTLGEAVAADEAYETAARGTGTSAALAAYLIADEHHDAGRPTEAATAFERAFRDHPGSSYGSRALERLALLAFHGERWSEARSYLDEYRRRYPRGSWFQGATYWTGKTEEARGDTDAARAFFLEAFAHDPLDYYAILAARRLGRDRWETVRRQLAAPEAVPPLEPVYAGALDRMNRLREVGWTGRARREYREATARGPSDPDQQLAFAHALNGSGWTQEGIREGWRAKSRTPRWSRPLLEAIYPLPFREALVAAADRHGLQPHFVAGLSRRESMFDPEIVSPANAIGLMQLLPQTARDVAARAGLPEYRRSQLTVPQVNLLLGTQYLSDVLDRFGGARVAGMISYNAGPHRYVRWRDFPEFRDEEQLVERIPFRETREYVRAVTELAEIYRFLYPDVEPPTP